MALRPGSGITPEEKKAQREAAAEDVLLREVDEAVRQDQYSTFAKTYGRYLLVLLVVALFALAGWLYWQSHQNAAREADSEALIAALDQYEAGNIAAGDERVEALLTAENDGARTAAAMLKAGAALQAGRTEEAAKLYAGVSADGDAPPALRDLATIREIATTYDTRAPADVIARLKPLAVPGNAWFGSAGELVAMAYLEQGKRAEAGTLFGEIARSEDVPQTLRTRARQMAGLLGVDAVEDVDELLSSGTALPQGQAAQPAPPAQSAEPAQPAPAQ